MRKFKRIILLCLIYGVLIFAFSAKAMRNYEMPNNFDSGDYQNISVYEVSINNDSTARYIPISALYYPMEEKVIIEGVHYEIASNPDYNGNELTSIFLFIVGCYYTNLD